MHYLTLRGGAAATKPKERAVENLVRGSLWIHDSSGTVYVVVAESNVVSTKPEFERTVIYVDIRKGFVWSRARKVWDGKFSKIKASEEENVFDQYRKDLVAASSLLLLDVLPDIEELYSPAYWRGY